MIECNNKSGCHTLNTISDTDALRVICTQCKYQYVIRKDWRGVPENRQYSKIFRKEILQPKNNLFYKYYPSYLRT